MAEYKVVKFKQFKLTKRLFFKKKKGALSLFFFSLSKDTFPPLEQHSIFKAVSTIWFHSLPFSEGMGRDTSENTECCEENMEFLKTH